MIIIGSKNEKEMGIRMLYILRFDCGGVHYKVVTSKNESSIKSRVAREVGVCPNRCTIVEKCDELPHHDLNKIKKKLKDNGFTFSPFCSFGLPKDWSEDAMVSLVKNYT